MRQFFRRASNWLGGASRHRAPVAQAGLDEHLDEGVGPSCFDQSEELSITYELLDDARAWRERAVHEILLRDGDHFDASAAYQIRLPLELIRRYEPTVKPGDRVRLLLPIAARPKRPLLNFEIAGAEGSSASLVLKRDAAVVQACYMTHVERQPLGEQPLREALRVGVSDYTAGAWREKSVNVEAPSRRLRRSNTGDAQRAIALATYINADLELGIDARHVTRWLRQMEDARLALVDALGEGEDPLSSSECILLAMPYMPLQPSGIADIDILVTEFCAAVDTTVPVGRPCTIKISEQRPWLDSPSSCVQLQIAFGDAVSTHVEIRAADHGVVLEQLRVDDLEGKPVDVNVAEDAREAADALAMYGMLASRIRPGQTGRILAVP